MSEPALTFTEGVGNPLLEEWQRAGGTSSRLWELDDIDRIVERRLLRDDLVTRYAWAVPTDEALQAIVDHSPRGVVEMGAGTGYWAMLLRNRGVDVIAYDRRPGANMQARCLWTHVEVGGPKKILAHHDRFLMLCWPPYDSPMAWISLLRYHGDTLIYIGERWGCTADDSFHAQLDEDWTEAAYVSIPNWVGMHDGLHIYRRRARRRGRRSR